MSSRFVFDGEPLAFADGDTIAEAVVRSGQHPGTCATLCLTGDCGSCSAVVDGVAWVRTCQTAAAPGSTVTRQPAVGAPSPFLGVAPTREQIERSPVSHEWTDVVVVGSSSSTGAAETARLRGLDRTVVELDANDGNEVVAVYSGPVVIVRRRDGMRHVHAHEVVLATGAAWLHPVCPGNLRTGLLTPDAALRLLDRDVALGRTVIVGNAAVDDALTAVASRVEGALVSIDGDGDPLNDRGPLRSVTVTTSDGATRRVECDTVVVALGRSSRDVLARMSLDNDTVRAIGPAANAHDLPPAPADGYGCPCSKITVEDWRGAWDRGFNELELMKRASLTGTGTCQGSACLSHLQAFIRAQTNDTPEPFTARPAARQLTLGEAGAGLFTDAWRRTPLHEEHIALGARMDRFGGWWRPWTYGDHVAEYWSVREAVSLGDVSTLGKMIIQGPDALEVLERLYPTTIGDIRPGRSRYVLLLNERGHLIDDGMVCRETEDRFVLTFTSGGAANAEAWVRDWVETWNLDVRLLDRTMALAAINVTGPLGSELLQRVGLAEPPKFLQHRHDVVAGVPCHVMRLSFTGEASWELHHPWDRSVELWRALMDAGRDLGVRPHGLKALFGLRLEKGHVIVGMDTEMDTTPRRIDHDWAVKMDKPFFLGQEALRRTAALPDRRRLVGMRFDGEAPMEGAPVHDGVGGPVVGHVTTSFTSPLLGGAVALGWVKRGLDATSAEVPETLVVDGRVATVTAPPFYDPEGRRARA